MSWTISLTLHLWWLWAYLAVGVVLLLPLTWALNHQITPRQTVRRTLRRYWRRVPLWIAAWPVSVWTLVEWWVSAIRRRRRAFTYPKVTTEADS